MLTCTYCHKELPNNGKKLISGVGKTLYYKSVKYCGTFCLKENWRFKNKPPIGQRKKKCVQCKKDFITGTFQPNRQFCCSKQCHWKYDYSKNKKRYIERSKKWGEDNPEKIRAIHKKYYWENHSHVLMRSKARNTAHVRKSEWIELCKKHNFTCKHCNKVFDISVLSIDHIVPSSLGGTNDLDNLQPSCLPCNQRKGNRFIG